MKNMTLKPNQILLIILFSLLVNLNSNAKPITPGEEEYIIATEKVAAPIGGLEGIMKKVTYPSFAQKAGIQGKVYMLIYVNEKGSVDDVKVVKGIGGGCDEEAAKVIKSSSFTPAEQAGAAVKSKLSMAISFVLK